MGYRFKEPGGGRVCQLEKVRQVQNGRPRGNYRGWNPAKKSLIPVAKGRGRQKKIGGRGLRKSRPPPLSFV